MALHAHVVFCIFPKSLNRHFDIRLSLMASMIHIMKYPESFGYTKLPHPVVTDTVLVAGSRDSGNTSHVFLCTSSPTVREFS